MQPSANTARADQFKHQTYRARRPKTHYEFIQQPQRVEPGSPEYCEVLAEAGANLAQANVAQVYCIHGTFAGNDLLGLLTELRRFAPSMSEQLRRCSKGIFDSIVGETGNFTRAYATDFERGISAAIETPIPVALFNWSSHNSHMARADGAVNLLDEIARRAEQLADAGRLGEMPTRVLLWAHSHGGNVCALVTNLLGATAELRAEFFLAARRFYQPWVRPSCDMPAWERVERLLADQEHPLRKLTLDIVTFGTPIRYGWNPSGYDHLLHFVHHRPPSDGAEWSTPRAFRLHRLLTGADGDAVQQIGIAGTNFLPNPLALRTLVANHRLHYLLERELADAGLIGRLAGRMRVPQEGDTLLVDYGERGWNIPRHLFGHGCYTRRHWLPFHLQQVAERFYSG